LSTTYQNLKILKERHVPLARGGNTITKQALVAAGMAATMGLSGVAVTDIARADGIFNSMNPFNWFSDRDHDYYRDRWYRRNRWGYPYGWGGPYGWNGPWGYPGYGRFPAVIVIPSGSSDSSNKVAEVRLPE
jgi:hypothetical protein